MDSGPRSMSSCTVDYPKCPVMPHEMSPYMFLPVGPSSSSQPATILGLPNDVLLLVIRFTNVRDILALRKTCKRFFSLTKLRWVWSDAVHRHIIAKGLPLPGAEANLRTLSGQHLETRTVHAAKFHTNWHSKQPTPRQAVEFHVVYPPEKYLPDDALLRPSESYTVQQVLFLRRGDGQFLVTLAGGIITCWEVPLAGSGAFRFAEHSEANGIKIKQIVVNEDPKHNVEVAYWILDEKTDTVLVRTLSLDMFHGQFKMCTSLLGLRSQCTPLHTMNGDNIAMGCPVNIWHFPASAVAGRMSILPLPLSPVLDAHDGVLTVGFIGQYIICVRKHSIELLTMPSWSSVFKRFKFEKLRPLNALIQTDATATEAVVVMRSQAQRGHHGWPSEPVTILLRSSEDGFNTILQYDLPPNPHAKGAGDQMVELPCLFPPSYARTTNVAPSCAGLRAGQGGKGFWMQTCNMSVRRCTYTARCLVGFDVRRSRCEEEREKVAVDRDSAGAVETGRSRGPSQQSRSGNDFHVCEAEIYSRRCDVGQIVRQRYSVVSADLNDIVGRVAIGDRNGKVTILDYV